MGASKDHRDTCPAAIDAAEACRCQEIEDAQLARASRPSAAEQIRSAKLSGDIKGAVFGY